MKTMENLEKRSFNDLTLPNHHLTTTQASFNRVGWRRVML